MIILAKRIFITATNTDIGKTYTTKLLMQELTKLGFRVGVIKPIETGVVDDVYPDGEVLLELLKQCNPLAWSLNVEDIVPISFPLPAAPYIASGFQTLNYEKIEEAIMQQEAFCDILLIEGAGGLFVPIDQHTMMIDLITKFSASALLVTHCSLGCINDTLLHKKALDERGITNRVVFNCKAHQQEGFEKISLPYFQKVFSEIFTTKQSEKLAIITSLLE